MLLPHGGGWCDERRTTGGRGPGCAGRPRYREGAVMSAGAWALFVAVFLACAVEAVEATTIVLAAGTARDWRSALTGTGAALVALAVIVAILGPAVQAIPLHALRLVVGALLLVFGLQWLRKAILR